MEQSEQKKLRRQNVQKEKIYRHHGETRYLTFGLQPKERAKYPWEMTHSGKHLKISKEFFRCKGSSLNPPHTDAKDPAHSFDCVGSQRHSLPMRENREFIYPILIDLLNYVQAKTECKVIVTCGHRCPAHNNYSDSSSYNRDSKHMIGAEVDFYVQGMEHRPEEIVRLIMDYYREDKDKNYVEFRRFERDTMNISTPPWYNKEIFVKLYKKNEGRDFDNRHPYPYLSIQVRHDRERNESVTCDWQKAFNGYCRY